MSLPPSIAGRLRLPAFCAPMFLVSTPELVKAACQESSAVFQGRMLDR